MTFDRHSTETILADLSEERFVEVWTEVVGEVPAAMLERPVMVEILLTDTVLRGRADAAPALQADIQIRPFSPAAAA